MNLFSLLSHLFLFLIAFNASYVVCTNPASPTVDGSATPSTAGNGQTTNETPEEWVEKKNKEWQKWVDAGGMDKWALDAVPRDETIKRSVVDVMKAVDETVDLLKKQTEKVGEAWSRGESRRESMWNQLVETKDNMLKEVVDNSGDETKKNEFNSWFDKLKALPGY